MDKEKFLTSMQQKVAYESITSGALGYSGEVGELQDLRNFTSEMDLSVFTTDDSDAFQAALEDQTSKLAEQVSAPRKNWGTARTTLNTFLQGALYNRYLSQKYDLYLAEHFMEIPLSKKTVDGLRRQPGGNALPEWTGLNVLKQDISAKYQDFAHEFAKDNGVARVHLNMFLWPGWDT